MGQCSRFPGRDNEPGLSVTPAGRVTFAAEEWQLYGCRLKPSGQGFVLLLSIYTEKKIVTKCEIFIVCVCVCVCV